MFDASRRAQRHKSFVVSLDDEDSVVAGRVVE
jgi:hypothetical protein